MVGATEVIRVSKPIKSLLNQLKIIEEESFNSVINRILQTKFEDCLELNRDTKMLLNKRVEKMKEGNVFPGKELLGRIKKKRRSKA